MQNFNTAELRPVEFARAYLQKKMLKKPLREDAGADVLRDIPSRVRVGETLREGRAAPAARARPAGPYSHHLYSKSPVCVWRAGATACIAPKMEPYANALRSAAGRRCMIFAKMAGLLAMLALLPGGVLSG